MCDDEIDYVPAPPNRTFYVRTRYIFKGKGGPAPFKCDDGMDDDLRPELRIVVGIIIAGTLSLAVGWALGGRP